MKNDNLVQGKVRFARVLDRLVATAAVMIFIWLIYLASQGRFDHSVNRFAAWLEKIFS